MSFEWPTKTLGEVCSKITDGAHHSPKSVTTGKPMASVKDLTRFGVDLSEARLISLEDFDFLVKQGCKPEVDDVLISKDGNSALDTVCNVQEPLEAVLLSSVAILRPNPLFITSDFLKYYLSSKDVIDYLKSNFISGAAIPRVVLKAFKKAEIKLPPLYIQNGITSILNPIDNRISLLRETNITLEAIAQALFKSWFVDFDPVKAKAEGRLPEGMDEATAALFPSEFEVSALGLIPKGWKVGALSELCKIASGKRPINRSDNEMQDASIPLYGGAGIMGFTSESLFHEPKILTGRVGTLGKVHLVYPPFWASDNVLVLSPIESRNFLFCFHWVSEVDVYALNRGSTQPLLTQKDLGNQQRTLPTDNVLDVFSEIVDTIYEKIRLNVKQSQTLTTLRDTLLPRLISGQLRLNQAQEIMDEVGA